MKYIFLLSGDYVHLGREEIISLFDVKNHKLADRLLIADLNGLDEKSVKRLALTKNIYQFLFECKINDLTKTMRNFDWDSVYKDNFCLRIENLNKNTNKAASGSRHKGSNPPAMHSEKNLAGYVWRSIKNPKVNLENPKTKIEIFTVGNRAYCGLEIFSNNENFENRKPHLRHFPHPSSLHPKVARALVNLTGIGENEVLLDPFCGTGGFLIESGLMGIKSIGYDINKIMINGCIENLKNFKIQNFKIFHKNALKIFRKFDYAVTDLPYGLNSNAMAMYEKNWKKHRINKKIETKDFIKNLEKFYLQFLKILRKKLKKKAVIVFPDYVDYKKLLKQSRFKIEKEFEDYVHRSLRREIVKILKD